jgi:hypothetical protein
MASFGWCVFAHVIMLSATCLVMVTALLFCLSLFLKDTRSSLDLAFILTFTKPYNFGMNGFLRTGGLNGRRRIKHKKPVEVLCATHFTTMRDNNCRHLESELLASIHIDIHIILCRAQPLYCCSYSLCFSMMMISFRVMWYTNIILRTNERCVLPAYSLQTLLAIFV